MRINASIERVFRYKACVNRTFPNTSRWCEITERERNELLLSVNNSHELGSSPFPYIAPVIPHPLQREVVGGEHFFLADRLKSISSSFSQAGSAREPQAEIAEAVLVSFIWPDQSPLREQDAEFASPPPPPPSGGEKKESTSLEPQSRLYKLPDGLDLEV